ncbi:MAG: hypothetical protein JW801_05395 [Bacteroidales bacterium]|nr:hypothetical protein [Bacteroidales bacterium]
MYGLILDIDPFEEFYVGEDGYFVADENSTSNYWLKENSEGGIDTMWHVYDTAKFRRTVDNEELGIYLKQLK